MNSVSFFGTLDSELSEGDAVAVSGACARSAGGPTRRGGCVHSVIARDVQRAKDRQE